VIPPDREPAGWSLSARQRRRLRLVFATHVACFGLMGVPYQVRAGRTGFAVGLAVVGIAGRLAGARLYRLARADDGDQRSVR
jgi:hypothetical protein